MSQSRLPGRRLAATVFAALAAAIVIPASASSAFAQSGGASTAPGDNARGVAGVTAEAWAAGRAKHGDDVTAAQAIVDYWTPARMRAATPIEESPQFKAALSADTQRQAQQESGSGSQARPGAEHHVEPTGAVGSSTLAAFNPNLSSGSPTARTAGKVFFTLSGTPYVCSGTVINSEGKDTVWTAGHCVHGGNGSTWASNWSFVPAYDDDLANPRPYGTWTSNHLWTKTNWANNSDFSDDMGVAIMNTLNGSHIVSQFGGQGIKVNAGKSVFDYAFGYPAETPFDGGNLYRCSGTTSSATYGIKMSCDMTRGSSGGGWLNAYDGNWGYLNGVNSLIDSIMSPTVMMSPYFDDTAWNLYNDTRYL